MKSKNFTLEKSLFVISSNRAICLIVILLFCPSGISRCDETASFIPFPTNEGDYVFEKALTVKTTSTISGITAADLDGDSLILNKLMILYAGRLIEIYHSDWDCLDDIFRHVPVIPKLSILKSIKNRNDAIMSLGNPDGKLTNVWRWGFFSIDQKLLTFASIELSFSEEGNVIGSKYMTGEAALPNIKPLPDDNPSPTMPEYRQTNKTLHSAPKAQLPSRESLR